LTTVWREDCAFSQTAGEALTLYCLSRTNVQKSMLKVNVSLYGSVARFGGGRYVAQIDVELEDGAGKADLLSQLGIPDEERGYLFINAMLCEVPGLSTEANELLNYGDHVGIFSVDRLFPYQYRDGLPMSDGLKEALKEHGAIHHSYK